MKLALVVVMVSLLYTVLCDVPTNCSFEDTVGHWVLHLGMSNQTNNINCNETFVPVHQMKIQLIFPNVVIDEDTGSEGSWTMVYNQG